MEPERERIAKIEIGHTDVSPVLARLLIAVFLVAIATVPIIDLLTGRAANTGVTPGSLAAVGSVARQDGWIAGSYALLRQMHQLEDGLERKSWLGAALLPRTQRVLTALGVGNEKVYLGRDRWLYYTPDVQYVTGVPFLEPSVLKNRRLGGPPWENAPQPDPISALLDFQRQLAQRGIVLLVMPTPLKPMIEPEGLVSGSAAPPLENPSWPDFVRRLNAAGLKVFDPSPLLAQEKAAHRQPQYLRTDTHWTPQAMDLVASRLAGRVAALGHLGPAVGGTRYVRQDQNVSNTGDLAVLLTLPSTHPLKEPESVAIQRVETAEGDPWKADPKSAVLLLGDSFTNIYSQNDLGWGTGAGLAEQLSYYLGRPIDRLALNSGGALNTRQRLAQDLATGNDRLAGKKIVVYQFAMRELAIGDWRLIAMGGTR